MNFIEKVFENQLSEPLANVIDHAKKKLTKTEQAQLLILLAEKLNVKPKHMTEASLSWKTYQSSRGTS